MREWNLKTGEPLSLTLSSDIRLGATDYVDDQIWELSLSGGDPPALAIQTTFGLRARSMRMFPRFRLGEKSACDPMQFSTPPAVENAFPNYISCGYSPFRSIDVQSEYWVPQPKILAGRITIVNSGKTSCAFFVDWIAQLNPINGVCIAAETIQTVTVLSGSTGGLWPVVFITGGATSGEGAYPSLGLKMELAMDETRQLIWVQAAMNDREASFNMARSIAARNWEAEISRVMMLNSGQIEIFTGDPDWDAAFMLAQRQAMALIVGPTPSLPAPSFVLTRNPDQGYSIRGDGTDYDHHWNGQTPVEAYFLTSLLLPQQPDLVKGILQNFLATQTDEGKVDWKPGLAGQRSQLLATPILSSLVWKIYEFTEDEAFINENYLALMRFFNSWFLSNNDRDGDGIPEWTHLVQSGMDEHPVYSRWYKWSQGADISTSESVALCSFLYREATTLIYMAGLLHHEADIPVLEEVKQRLSKAVESSWEPTSSSYMDWDRDTHLSSHGATIIQGQGSGTLWISRDFDQPVRLLVDLRTDEKLRRQPLLFIHGKSASGKPRVERIDDEQFNWTPGWGRMTGRHIYNSIQRIELLGIGVEDKFSFRTVGYDVQDISKLLPLWAEIPTPERAAELVSETLVNPERFWRKGGLPTCAQPVSERYAPAAVPSVIQESPPVIIPPYETNPPVVNPLMKTIYMSNQEHLDDLKISETINILWNSLIAEGLVLYEAMDTAVELIQRLMASVIHTLKSEAAFRRYYHADSSEGIGERNALGGLAPLGPFLQVLGVKIISPTRVHIKGFNPFPWPVTVKYRGLTVLRQKEKTSVIFPDGQALDIDDPTPRLISLER